MLFSFRMMKYFVCWMLLWQDSMIGGSIFEIRTYIGGLPGVRDLELYIAVLAMLTLFERTLKNDFTVRRSYFSAPLILIIFAFALSWVRGLIVTQRFVPVLEIHEAFAWPFAFFIIANAFREQEDREVLWKLIMLAVIPKALEGVFIYYFINDSGKEWGVVQLWRDAYLLGIGAASLMLLAHYHGRKMRNVKRLLFLAAPAMGFTFIMSFRRTFLVSAFASMVLMFLTLPRTMRKRQFLVAFGFLGFIIVSALLTNPLAILARMSGIFEPKTEGSAYIRLLEWPNVIQNIIHNPIFGTPVGVPWKTYYRMPISAVYTTLGTHNTYFYWALRAGIAGLVAFFWLLGKLWKSALINYTLRDSEEDFLFGQLSIHLLIMYNVACLFGLMYAEDMPIFMAVVITLFQLQTKHVTGRYSLKEVSLLRTLKTGKLSFKARYVEALAAAPAAVQPA